MSMPDNDLNGATASSSYTSRNITVLEGLEAVRRRPGMYIGSTDERGFHHLVYEIVDNAIDEAMAGYCDHILVRIEKDGGVLVQDNGRGIPFDPHPVTGLSGLETVLTSLHSGAKFGAGGYKVSGGLHGVGAHVVNALSSRMRVEVQRDGRRVYQEFSRGKAISNVTDIQLTGSRGTTVTFKPDTQIFGEQAFDYDTLVSRFREMAYLNKGVEIQFIDESDNHETTFYFEGGIASFVRHLNANRRSILERPFYIDKSVGDKISGNDVSVELAVQYNDGFAETVLTFANCINTRDGGTHLTGFRSGLTRALNDYGRRAKLLKEDVGNLSGDDVREGLTAVISVRLTEPQFEGQTKGKLGNAEVKGYVEQVLTDTLGAWLDEHPIEGRKLIDKCLTAARAREAARKARDLVIRKTSMEGGMLPGKLSDCSERDPSRCEIYIVEGESAGGSAKMGRDRRFQAILPLKGKILNVEKARLDRMLGHEEIRTLITALGTGIGETFNLEKLRYQRVIIMTDADVDGSHIRTLLLTFFFRHMQEVIGSDFLYIAQPPLYKVAAGRTYQWAYSERDRDRITQDFALRDVSVQKIVEGAQPIPEQELKRYLEQISETKLNLADLADKGIPTGVLLSLAKHLNFENLSTADFADEADVQAVAALLEATGVFHEVRVARADESHFSLDVRNGDADARHRLDAALLHSPSLKKLHDAYTVLSPLDSGEAFRVARRDRELGTFTSVESLLSTIDGVVSAGVRGLTVQRYKGLGEMNADQLWESTMDPKTRVLLRVGVEDAVRADDVFQTLMGEEVQPRKQFIQAYAKNVKNLDI